MIEIIVEDVELEEGKYRGYDIKKQSRKDGHPLIVPAMQISGTNMKDIKRMIDDKIKKNPKLEVEEIMSTSSDVDMNPTGKPKKKMKKKCETFSVSDDCFHKFRHGKTKFERWSKYLDLTDSSQKKIYDWAKRHHNGTIILKNAQTGQVRGIRYNRTGGGKWGSITKLKEQVLETNRKFTVK